MSTSMRFPLTVIPAGGTCTLSERPREGWAFRGTHFEFEGRAFRPSVPGVGGQLSPVAGALLVCQVRVGKRDQLNITNPVPAKILHDPLGVTPLSMETAESLPPQTISVVLTNCSAADVEVDLRLHGVETPSGSEHVRRENALREMRLAVSRALDNDLVSTSDVVEAFLEECGHRGVRLNVKVLGRGRR